MFYKTFYYKFVLFKSEKKSEENTKKKKEKKRLINKKYIQNLTMIETIIQCILLIIVIQFITSKYKLYFCREFTREEVNVSIGWKYAIMIPIFGSIFLVIMFFYPDIVVYFLKFVFALTILISNAFIIRPILVSIVSKIHISLSENMSYIVSFIIAFILLILCYFNMNWITIDIICCVLSIFIQSSLLFEKINVPMILNIAMLFYDLFWVFGSKKVPVFEGKSVMEENAMTSVKHNLAMMFTCKGIITHSVSFLGMGDIIVPGFITIFCVGIDHFLKTKYFIWTTIGHILGLIIADICVIVFQSGQPALIYIVPSIVIMFIIYGIKTHTLKQAIQINLKEEFLKEKKENEMNTIEPEFEINEPFEIIPEVIENEGETIVVDTQKEYED